MFDTTCANICGLRKAGIDIPVQDKQQTSNDRIGVITWEEHCVECGQPECFKTCKFFERNYDGKCRRFDYGIVYQRGLHICSFRPWGKLEAVYTGRARAAQHERMLAIVDRGICGIARAINRLMSFIQIFPDIFVTH